MGKSVAQAKPLFKATRVYGVRYTCSCGWRSTMWMGKGAQRSAAGELTMHKQSNPETHLWDKSSLPVLRKREG